MIDLLIIFSNNLLPILFAAGAGYLVARYLGITPKSVSQIAFYIFSPCLIFNLLTSSKLDGDGIVTSGGRVLAVSATGADLASARTAAYAAVDRIEFEDAEFRSDIAAL